MRRANHFITLLSAVFVGLIIWSTACLAFEAEFHGYLESRGIWRDTSGFQYGFMDDMDMVQWIQELQLDMEVRPEYEQGQPAIRFEKAFFRYRGAYDAIFDVTDRYDDVMHNSTGDFELGKRDLRWDQDLREGFADLVAESKHGDLRANLRLGKQIVQWGEADGFNLINIVNPNDLYNKAFFSNPEDLLAPLWMGRLDVNFPGQGIINNFNMQLLAIPDVRPHVFAPLNAPYQLGATFKEDVEDDMEFGVRLGAVTATSSFYIHYFDGYQDAPAIDISTVGDGYLTLRHPESKTIGYSFNRFFETGNFVLRGEGSMTEDKTFTDYSDPTGRGYTKHDFYQVLFGVDKTLSNMPIGTDSAVTTAYQIYYARVDDWDENEALGRTTPEETWRATMLFTTDYVHGTITPTIYVMYDSEEAWLTQVVLNWSPDGKYYVNLSQTSVWGDTEGNGDYNPYIDSSSEVCIKIGYRW
jgi:hypothetical protein